MERKLAAILAADVVGYSAHMERDEAGTFDRLKAGRKELFEPEIKKHHGRIFKLMGDGLLAEFGSVVDAVECAVALQRGLAERNDVVPANERTQVRIGINLGEVIVDGEDRYGEGVNIATRLEQIAEPGSVYVSGKVAKEVEKKLTFGFEPMGEQKVKNLAEPVPVYRVTLGATPVRSWSRRPPSGRKFAWPSVAAGVVVAAVGGWLHFGSPLRLFAPPATAGAPSIAVLAFDNLSGDPKLDYVGEGVSEDIISMLARSPDLSVIARNSSFTYKGTPTDVRKIGSDLQVNFVLEGSVRKDADKIRIVAQLVNAQSGEHVWAERFDETGDDPFLIQDAVTEKIVTALAGDTGEIRRSLRKEAWHKDAASLAEYDYYLRGHSLFFRNTSKDMAEAIRIWSEGLSKFPDSALLKFKLGFAYYISLIYGWSHDTEGDMLRIRSFARDGLAKANLTPLEIKLGHWLMVYVHLVDRDFKASLREAEAAIQKAPSDAYMLPAIGDAAVSNKEYDKAISWIDFGIRNDPVNNSLYAAWKGWALTSAERYKESAELMKDVPDFYEQVPLTRALNAVHLGDLDEAKKQVKKALELNPNGGVKYFRAATFVPQDVLERQIMDLKKAGFPDG